MSLRISVTVLFTAILFFVSCSSNENEGIEFTGEYIEPTLPGNSPVMFLPEIITEEIHSPVIFSPDGTEAYWTPLASNYSSIRFMKRENGIWRGPEILTLDGSGEAGEPFFSWDGNRLYFISKRNPGVTGYQTKENIWYVEKTISGWSQPVILPGVINDLGLHWTFSLSQSGNLYFGAHPMGETVINDIYKAVYENGGFARVELLDSKINTNGSEDTPFIAPDESYLIFARLPFSSQNADMFISFKEDDGSWCEAINMGNSINTPQHDLGPCVTRDGQFLFYISYSTGEAKPYWVSAEIINELRENR